jgi:hypothetical protein
MESSLELPEELQPGKRYIPEYCKVDDDETLVSIHLDDVKFPTSPKDVCVGDRWLAESIASFSRPKTGDVLQVNDIALKSDDITAYARRNQERRG